MHNPDDASSTCPHCHRFVAEGVRVCPHCGTSVPPSVPALGDAPDTTPLFLTGSRGGDTAVGFLLGIALPPIAVVAWASLLSFVVSEQPALKYSGLAVVIWGAVLGWLAALFFLARSMKKSRYVLVQVTRKFFLGWLITVTVITLGILATCLFNSR